jgi:glucan phosphoethanolaminetransferase (alkaline phosphatase superfamily)
MPLLNEEIDSTNSKSSQMSVWFGLLLMLFLLMLPNILLLMNERATFSLARAGEIAGTGFFLWLVLLVFSARIWIFFILILPVLWIMPLEAVYIANYANPSDIHIFGILSDTTFDESSQYIKKYLFFILIYLLLISVSCYYLSRCAFRQQIRLPTVFIRSVMLGTIVFLSFMGMGNYLLAKQETDYQLVGYATFNEKGGDIPLLFGVHYNAIENSVVDIFPFGILVKANKYHEQVEQMAKLQKDLESFRFGAHQKDENTRQIYVLVIGETTRSKNFQLNGYERNTNPLLSQRKNLVSFTNMVSGWAWTRMSVPVIISRKKVHDKNIFFPEKSIVSLFSEAGFDTAWLSTQSPYGFHDSPIALHAREAKFVHFMNPADYKSPGLYDDVMLADLKRIVATGDKHFIVLHTLGSHFNYKDRYPDQFDVFQPSMKSDDVSLQNRDAKKRLLNSYDNSILFTDFFLNQVIEIVDTQKTESAVFYISDHGEVIFDGECDKSGHGQHTEYDHMPASLLWVSDLYRQKNETKVKNAFDKINSPLSTENIFHSLAGLANLTYDNQDDTWDISSDYWHSQPRYLQSGLNFDSSGRSEQCKEIIPKK